ncbi:Her2p [Malassezia vespertilionis]|uniref:Glutamyl-tRNA(Gln) amidotransferase subunit A, mitochondrial n=1 Tax=Malassezia vespertilionis TaxID=2020962 RepID=A0A2N1JG72_9BASI|nr:Her2p [Malassezia vespertilionis]
MRSCTALRSASTFARGPHDPFNALTAVFPRSEKSEGLLAQWSVSIKENICMQNVPATCSSKFLLDYKSPFDAAVVQHLRNAGAHLTSRTNCDEFGMGGLNVHSHFGPVANPAVYEDMQEPDFAKFKPRSPGGSSGGAGAAVRAGLCRVAIGTDTGGSVRLPASYCGVYGLKPSYGMVSRWGVISYGDSLDHVGIIARSIPDIRTTLRAISHDDGRDATCTPAPLRSALEASNKIKIAQFGKVAQQPLHGLRVGIPREMFPEEMNPGIADATDQTLDALQALGATLIPFDAPSLVHAVGAYYVLALAEASSSMARFDGMQYGAGTEALATYRETIAANRGAGFGDEVRKRILLGTYALTADAMNSYYMRAKSIRAVLEAQVRGIWSTPDLRSTMHLNGQGIDVVVHPTALQGAPLLGKPTDAEYAQDVMTVPGNLTGLPVLSAPAHATLRGSDVGIRTFFITHC